MKKTDQTQSKILTLISSICLLTPIFIYCLWIYVFNLVNSQIERVVIFNDYFPDFLHGRFSITLVSLFFCVTAIILSSRNLKVLKKKWKLVNILILLFSSSLLALNLFTIM